MSKFSRPKVGVALAIRRGNEILLHKRKGKHANGCWGMPGGHLEMWETFVQCAKRELREEAGSKIKINKPILWGVENTRFTEEGRHYVVVFMIADWISGEPEITEPDKNAGWGWFPWNKLPKPLMMGIKAMKSKYKML
jgi:8-oxo-dGTP diphosphatase